MPAGGIADIEPAGKGDHAIDHEDLAVVAQVRVGVGQRKPYRKETRHGYATPLQFPTDRWPGIARTQAIDEHPHLDTPGHRRRQRRHEIIGDDATIEDVGRQRDAVAGARNGLEHGRKSLVAIQQRLNVVPALERLRGNPVRQRDQRLPGGRNRTVASTTLPLAARDLVFRVVRPAHLAHPPDCAPDAVDPEQQVGHRAEERRQPDQARPANRRPHFGLGEQDMHGRQDGEQEVGQPRNQLAQQGLAQREPPVRDLLLERLIATATGLPE